MRAGFSGFAENTIKKRKTVNIKRYDKDDLLPGWLGSCFSFKRSGGSGCP